jgi:hypothetical protein
MDPQVDDILKELKDKGKSKIKSGPKGKGAEREVAKLLNKRFEDLLKEHSDWGQFSRSVGSGNRWGQTDNLPKHAQDTFSGDLCVPEHFLWVLESKKGYNDDIDLCTLFGGTNALLDGFLKQVEDDSGRCGRKPMLIWKKDYKPRLAFIKKKDAPPVRNFSTYMVYKCWLAVPCDELLKMDDSFFFSLD